MTEQIQTNQPQPLSKKAKYRARRKNKSNVIQKLEIPDIQEISSRPIDNFDDDPMYQDLMEKMYSKAKIVQTVPEKKEEENQIPENEPVNLENLKISNQKMRKYGRPSVGQLKEAISRRPDLVEPNDTNALDPFALILLKSCHNSVPVPSHWNQKRRYLNFKKGSEISRYRLPIYLEKTGIPQMRKALLEADQLRSVALKQRERTRPRTGQFDVNPEVLISAFFNQQTKPYMSRFGEVYFEGAEFIPNPRKVRPGKLSQKLRDALGMTENMPPPWLKKMQLHGPPPSYPHLKIPGLNAPLPKGAHWGSDAAGWGNVPLNPADGKPLFGGNPFGNPDDEDEEPVVFWGELTRSEKIADGVNI